jgi:hypothetical protein
VHPEAGVLRCVRRAAICHLARCAPPTGAQCSPTGAQIQATRLVPLLSPKQKIADATGRVFLAERQIRRLQDKLQHEQQATQWLEQELARAREREAQAHRDREVAELVRDRVSQQLADATRQLETAAAAAAQQVADLTAEAAEAQQDAEARADEAEGQVQCIACCAAVRSYLPSCGHLVMCHACAARCKACPMCYKKLRIGRKVFLS